MDRLLQDLRFAARLLWKDRAFTVTTLATLALCIAANTAIFAIVNAVLLRPLPFPEPERILIINNAYPKAGVEVASNGVPDYFDRLRDMTVFEELAMYRSSSVTVGGQGSGEPERVISMPVTPSFFRLLRVQAARGRTFLEEDAEVGTSPKVMLSHGIWQRRLGGREDVVGSEFRINGVVYTVVGIAPQEFRFINPDVELWTAAVFPPIERSDQRRHSNNWQQIGRLKPNATLDQAQRELNAINAANFERFPQFREILTNAGFHTRAAVLQDVLVRDARPTLFLLWAGVVLVLVIGAVNIANLTSVRATTRMRELATRTALGATISRLTTQLFTETFLVAIFGGVAGVVLGGWALSAADFLGFTELPRGEDIALDRATLFYTFALVVGVGLIVGTLPVAALRRANVAQIVREEGRSGTTTRATRTLRRVLVTSQVAFALLLLVGAGLLVSSFERILAIDPGFRSENVVTADVSLPAARYRDLPAVRTAVARMLTAIRALPGVEAAGTTSTIPLSGSYNDSVILVEGYQMAPGESLISPGNIVVSEGYFEAMGVQLIAGRFFDQRDADGAPRAIIVDERLARKFWPNQSPIGKRMYFPGNPDNLLAPPPPDGWMTVVGVVGEMRTTGLVESVESRRVGAYYLPFQQATGRTPAFAIRTSVDPTSVINAVRAAVAAIDPELPLSGVRLMSERVDQWLVDRRTPMLLATGFAGIALLLSAIGIYGMLAYQVSQRRREIGIRMALGAEATGIFRMVLREGAAIVGIGAACGLTAAYLLRSRLESQLYDTGALDPRVLVSVSAVLFVVAFIACVLPARKAARTDPIVALTD